MKIFKRVILFFLGLTALSVFAFFTYYLIVTSSIKLDVSRLQSVQNEITVYGRNDEILSECSALGKVNTSYSELPDYLVNAFVCTEDKGFFSHKGLDYKRMTKALLKNIASFSFKEGASTISQQLVKNTQLSSEKTINRKLKEIKLTKELERKYSKEEIMEMYLNTIYFGHSCFGLNSASEFYFDKKPSELSVAQSAMLAGLVKSPNNYSPLKNPEKSVRRRNFILKKMEEQGFIDAQALSEAKKEPIPLEGHQKARKNLSLFNAVTDEYEKITEETVYGGIKIFTYIDGKLQNKLESLSAESETDKSYVVLDAATRGVKGFYSTIGQAKRLPGSTLKPLLVYAPALQENVISPATPILDEKINYAGYSPKNSDGEYHGYVSARTALAASYNIPAVKILNEIGVKKALSYAEKMNLEIEEDDATLALALGGMKEGYSLPDLCGAYAVFSDEGIYEPISFIRKIVTEDGKVLYEKQSKKNKVFENETVTLLNDMLKTAAKSGTARKMKKIPYEVCAKTGTCGNETGNTDAYCISYTSSDIIGVWLGNADNSEMQNISGGGLPTNININIQEFLYGGSQPNPLKKSENVKKYTLDKREYNQKHNLILCDDNAPVQEKTLTELFKKENAPAIKSTYFSKPKLNQCEIAVKNGAVFIELCQTEYISFIINRQGIDGFQTVYQGKGIKTFKDENVIQGEKYIYSVTPYYEKFVGNTIILPQVIIGISETIRR